VGPDAATPSATLMWAFFMVSGSSNYHEMLKWCERKPDTCSYSQQSASWLSVESVSHSAPLLLPCASLSASFPASYKRTSCRWPGPGMHTPRRSLLCRELGTCGTCIWWLAGCWRQQKHTTPNEYGKSCFTWLITTVTNMHIITTSITTSQRAQNSQHFQSPVQATDVSYLLI